MRIDGAQLGVRPLPPVFVRPRMPVYVLSASPAARRLRLPLGMGDTTLVPVSSFSGSALTAQDLQAYEVALPSGIPDGSAATPDQFQANITQDVASICAQFPDRCPSGVPTSDIQAAVAQYAADYAAQQAQTAAEASQGLIALPAGSPYLNYQIQSAPSSSSGSGSGSQRASVSYQNRTRPGMEFQVGDSYAVTITGPANAPVSVTGTQNGNSLGTTTVGTTNASGNFTLLGVMDQTTVGNWYEDWAVGGQDAGTLSFSVTPASTANTQQSAPVSSPVMSVQPQPALPQPLIQATPAAAAAPAASSSASSSSSSLLTSVEATGADFWATYVQPNMLPIGIGLAVLVVMWMSGRK